MCFRTTSYPQSIELTTRIFLLTYKTVQGRSFFTAYKGRQNAINSEEDIKKIDDDGIFEVYKAGGGKHTVSFSTPECTCKDWIRHHIPCKHFFAIFEHFPGWGWSELPQHFLGSSYLSADTTSVHKYLNTEEAGNEAQPSDFQCEDLSLPQIPQRYIFINTCTMYIGYLYANIIRDTIYVHNR